ncbi:MAG: hypothetical protein KME43_16230 [Myxacorys chilensis ATA2-1-KO14]|jgi:hypothetical protein|nr:hypothetical protein [Myxacorys chilensis ATA2-1-KO14]
MGIGGYREGSGRKPEWSSPVERIRLPIDQHESLKRIAKAIDCGENLIVVPESELEKAISDILKTVPPTKRSSVARLFNRLKGVIGMSNR